MIAPAESYAADFRSEACLISARFLAARGLTNAYPDLTRCDASLCVPAPHDRDAVRARLRRAILGTSFVGFGFLIVGAIFGATNDSLPLPRDISISIAIAFGAVGMLTTFSMVNVQNALVRRELRRLAASIPAFNPTENIINLSIENPETLRVVKVVTEDFALCYCDASRQLIVIEGISHRYVIRAADIISMNIHQPASTRFAVIVFQIADSSTTLQIAISYNGFLIELKRQLSANTSQPPIIPIFERTLQLPFPFVRPFAELQTPQPPPLPH